MPKYVDAEKIEKTLWDSLRGYRHVKEKCAVKNCILEIEEAPTVDVVEVKHGIKHKSSISNTGLMCTACFSDIDRDAVFCKYCGAKMDGIKDG